MSYTYSRGRRGAIPADPGPGSLVPRGRLLCNGWSTTVMSKLNLRALNTRIHTAPQYPLLEFTVVDSKCMVFRSSADIAIYIPTNLSENLTLFFKDSSYKQKGMNRRTSGRLKCLQHFIVIVYLPSRKKHVWLQELRYCWCWRHREIYCPTALER